MYYRIKFELIVIVAILTVCVYSVGYSHSGRTNSSGCHRVTATGGYHCHGGGSSSSSSSLSSSPDLGQDDRIILVGGIVVILVICWAIVDPDSCCLFDNSHDFGSAQYYLNQLPMRLPVNTSLVPRFNFARQEHAGWEFSVGYTFRF